MALRIPIPARPSLVFSVTLGGQRCKITLRQLSTGLFMDVTANGAPIVSGAICLDRVRIIRYTHLGFVGDLVFVDSQGLTDPQYAGFGLRYTLLYLESGDIT